MSQKGALDAGFPLESCHKSSSISAAAAKAHYHHPTVTRHRSQPRNWFIFTLGFLSPAIVSQGPCGSPIITFLYVPRLSSLLGLQELMELVLRLQPKQFLFNSECLLRNFWCVTVRFLSLPLKVLRWKGTSPI